MEKVQVLEKVQVRLRELADGLDYPATPDPREAVWKRLEARARRSSQLRRWRGFALKYGLPTLTAAVAAIVGIGLWLAWPATTERNLRAEALEIFERYEESAASPLVPGQVVHRLWTWTRFGEGPVGPQGPPRVTTTRESWEVVGSDGLTVERSYSRTMDVVGKLQRESWYLGQQAIWRESANGRIGVTDLSEAPPRTVREEEQSLEGFVSALRQDANADIEFVGEGQIAGRETKVVQWSEPVPLTAFLHLFDLNLRRLVNRLDFDAQTFDGVAFSQSFVGEDRGSIDWNQGQLVSEEVVGPDGLPAEALSPPSPGAASVHATYSPQEEPTPYPYFTLEQAVEKGLAVCIPLYIPVGMEALESGALLKDGTLDRAFFAYVGPGKNFLTGTQDRRPADSAPLEGRQIAINGKTAFVRALATARDLPQYPDLNVEGTVIAWDEGDFRVQVLSTLPEEQVLLVAQSMSDCGSEPRVS
jgi:hypothetical protein